MHDIRQILTKYWGYSHFRPLQEDIIRSVMDGKDTLALLPTGGGKSLCYQVPALAKEGICLVISPLIALMKDQVENLQRRHIPSIAVFSGMSRNEVDIALDNCIYGRFKLLYLSPERLTSELVRTRLRRMNISLVAVDEAHCISQWGYDFRPSYLKIAEVREYFPRIPVLALTATATPAVKEDIQQKLNFRSPSVFQDSFARKNLSFIVLYEENKLQRLLNIAKKIGGSGIVYVRSRKKTKEVADFLNRNDIAADYYHAGLDTPARNARQENWIREKFRVMAATNAFGMGIDKPNVRFVVHLDLPDSLEAYYQEAGRAGRDGLRSYAVMIYNEADEVDFTQRTHSLFPSLEEIRTTYQALANYYQVAVGSGEGYSFDFHISEFCTAYQLNPTTVFNALHVLELEGWITTTDSVFIPSRIHFTVNNDELYRFQIAHPRYDPFIKIILRSYGGVFENYVRISEHDLSVRSGVSQEDAARLLIHLDKQGILNYLPQKDKPQVIFQLPRADAKHLTISRENLQDRKKRYLKKMEAVLEYASKTTKCRSQIILGYLGEEDTHRCGTCDVCIERNKLELSEFEFGAIKQEIKTLLTGRALPIEELLEKLTQSDNEKSIRVIRWLLDNDKMKFTSDNKLAWHSA